MEFLIACTLYSGWDQIVWALKKEIQLRKFHVNQDCEVVGLERYASLIKKKCMFSHYDIASRV